MKVIAARGESSFLVEVSDGKGNVVDVATKRVSPLMDIHSFLKFGYWEDFKGSKNEEQVILNLL